MRVCAQGVADYLKQANLTEQGCIIGYDNRFTSEDFAAAAAEVVAGNGIKVYLCPRATPTPVVSYGVMAKKAGGAIIITASHNPAIWNGFKYKDKNGSSASDEITAKIESGVDRAITTGKVNQLPLDDAIKNRQVQELDLDPAYFEQMKKLVDLEAIKRAGLKLVVVIVAYAD